MNYQLYTKLGYCTNKISERRGFFELGRIIDHKATECREKNRAASPRVRRYNRRNANDPDCSHILGSPGCRVFLGPSQARAPPRPLAECRHMPRVGKPPLVDRPDGPGARRSRSGRAAPGRLLTLPRRRPGHFSAGGADLARRWRRLRSPGRLSDRRRTLGAAQWTAGFERDLLIAQQGDPDRVEKKLKAIMQIRPDQTATILEAVGKGYLNRFVKTDALDCFNGLLKAGLIMPSVCPPRGKTHEDSDPTRPCKTIAAPSNCPRAR